MERVAHLEPTVASVEREEARDEDNEFQDFERPMHPHPVRTYAEYFGIDEPQRKARIV